jgi:hypothetical protein
MFSSIPQEDPWQYGTVLPKDLSIIGGDGSGGGGGGVLSDPAASLTHTPHSPHTSVHTVCKYEMDTLNRIIIICYKLLHKISSTNKMMFDRHTHI